MQSRTMTRKPSGRPSPHKGKAVPSATSAPTAPSAKEPSPKWDVQDSRSVRSGWIWRGFLILTLLALGVAIIMAGNHHPTLAIFWVVIAVGWLVTSMWLWRQHSRYMRG